MSNLVISSLNVLLSVNGNTATATQTLYDAMISNGLGSGSCTQLQFQLSPSQQYTYTAATSNSFLLVIAPKVGDYLSQTGNILANPVTALLTTGSGTLTFKVGGLFLFTDTITSIRLTNTDSTAGNIAPITLIAG